MKYVIDASSLLDLWKTYPKKNFPPLYIKLKEEFKKCVLIKPIEDEIKDEDKGENERIGKLLKWLKTTGIIFTALNEKHEQKFTELTNEYKFKFIVESGKKKGCSNADVKLISYAIKEGCNLISEEKSAGEKKETHNYSIPNVCKDKQIKCIKFVQFIKDENIIAE